MALLQGRFSKTHRLQAFILSTLVPICVAVIYQWILFGIIADPQTLYAQNKLNIDVYDLQCQSAAVHAFLFLIQNRRST